MLNHRNLFQHLLLVHPHQSTVDLGPIRDSASDAVQHWRMLGEGTGFELANVQDGGEEEVGNAVR